MKRFHALSALLLSLRLLCPAVLASEPPPLEPRLTVLDESIRLEILSTGPLALSNYDFDLEPHRIRPNFLHFPLDKRD